MPTCKPISRVLWRASPPDHHSSGTCFATRHKLTTRAPTVGQASPMDAPICHCTRPVVALPAPLLAAAVGFYPTVSPVPAVARRWFVFCGPIRERRGRRSPEFLWWLALRCPDFPQVLRAAPAAVWFAYQALAHLLPWGKPHDEAQSGQGHLGPRLSFYPPGYPQALLIFSVDFIKYPLRYPTASHRFPLSPKYHHG